jgi:hypothetical protein
MIVHEIQMLLNLGECSENDLGADPCLWFKMSVVKKLTVSCQWFICNLIQQVKSLLSFRSREAQLSRGLNKNVMKKLSLMNVLGMISNLGKGWTCSSSINEQSRVLTACKRSVLKFPCPWDTIHLSFLHTKVFGERNQHGRTWHFKGSKKSISTPSLQFGCTDLIGP